MTKCQR